MCRVKMGKVTKPAAAPGGGAPPRRRGRPAIDWTRSRKRRLLRLYLCTPESELSLKKILEILADGPFQPKPRHTQCLLNDMLSKSYRQKRPKNRTTMGERVAYLKSIRAGSPLTTDSHAAPRREVMKDCAILLKPRPRGHKINTQARYPSGEPDDLDWPCSPTHPRPDTASGSSHRSLDTGEPRTSVESESADETWPSPQLFRNPWSPYEDVRCEKVEFLRERCPSRSSSFLADVASLLSGLSIRSSLSRSSSGSSRRSRRSVASRGEPSGSGLQGSWDLERPSTGVSLAESLAWSGDLPLSADPSSSTTAWIGHMTRDTQHPGSDSHTLENQELVRFCCSKTSWCIHQRINAVLMHGSPADTFVCTTAEVTTRDGLGNTALHVAARWGAPGPVLFRIMTALASSSSLLGAANHRGETFLHVLDPSSLDPGDLAHLTQYLVSSGYDGFTQLDGAGETFVARLMARPSFSLESLEAVFCHLSEADRLMLLRSGGGPNRRLVDAIRARLLADPAQTAESVAAYCGYFSASYGGAGRG